MNRAKVNLIIDGFLLVSIAAIVGISRKLIPDRLARRVAAAILAALVILLTTFPAFVNPELQRTRQE